MHGFTISFPVFMLHIFGSSCQETEKFRANLCFDSSEHRVQTTDDNNKVSYYIFYQGFLSRTLTIHRTAGEGGWYLFNSSLPLPLASQTLRH